MKTVYLVLSAEQVTIHVSSSLKEAFSFIEDFTDELLDSEVKRFMKQMMKEHGIAVTDNEAFYIRKMNIDEAVKVLWT